MTCYSFPTRLSEIKSCCNDAVFERVRMRASLILKPNDNSKNLFGAGKWVDNVLLWIFFKQHMHHPPSLRIGWLMKPAKSPIIGLVMGQKKKLITNRINYSTLIMSVTGTHLYKWLTSKTVQRRPSDVTCSYSSAGCGKGALRRQRSYDPLQQEGLPCACRDTLKQAKDTFYIR